ncbi:hypothetical protein [Burkholderia sp. BCC0322]|uniref:hypothetical protein n=1 Tax=unclassified Burkholderia TaxID=2613784 RepID=UPI00158F21D1|nr:hypothetical protein [Burkholderia sp. BCC0322]
MVNSVVELVVVSGLRVLLHLQAALVYAVDSGRHFVTCVAWRHDLNLLAKTCNHCSQVRPVPGDGYVRFSSTGHQADVADACCSTISRRLRWPAASSFHRQCVEKRVERLLRCTPWHAARGSFSRLAMTMNARVTSTIQA